MPALTTIARLLLLATTSNAAINPRHAYRFLAERAASDPPCQFTPFFCDLDVSQANVFHLDYSTLTFDPAITQGNPTTAKFCIGSDCEISGAVSLEIRGTTDACASSTDATVVITFPAITNIQYVKEHIYVGAVAPSTPPALGSYPFTTENNHCDSGGAADSAVSCTIPLIDFLAAAGIQPACADNTGHSLYIVTHASVTDLSPTNGGSKTGTSEGMCLGGLNPAGKCSPWFKYATLKYDCTPCKLCNDCTCPSYAAAHKCDCNPDCTCEAYAAANSCECNPDANKCQCKPDCTCPDYATAHPDECVKWCPDTDTAYGYFPTKPIYQSQFNAANRDGDKLANKNCQSKWGWWDTFKTAELGSGSSYSGDLVAGAGNYNILASTKVGDFTLAVSNGQVSFSFTAASGFQFGTIHVQAGCAVPSTCAPGQFNNPFTLVLGGTGPTSGASGTLPLNLGSGCTLSSPSVYFIFHASVAKQVPISQACPPPVPQ